MINILVSGQLTAGADHPIKREFSFDLNYSVLANLMVEDIPEVCSIELMNNY